VTSVSSMRGLLSSSTVFSSIAIYSDSRSDVCPIISTSCRDLLIEVSRARLLIKGVIDSDLDHVSSHCALYKVCLRFLLFRLSILVYMPIEPIMLLDVSHSEIRDSVEIGGGGEDRGELRGEERGDNSDK
jgi:hypothetical protein